VSETASASGRTRYQNSHKIKPIKHTTSLEIEIPESNRRRTETKVVKNNSPIVSFVSFENKEETDAEVKERKRHKSGASTSLSEKYSLNTSASSEPYPQLEDQNTELTVTDFTKYH